jgi:hypothetical protein
MEVPLILNLFVAVALVLVVPAFNRQAAPRVPVHVRPARPTDR